MPSINSLPTLGDLLKFEAPQFYSRSAITIAAGQNLPMGTVLGRRIADDKHQAFDPAATDGTDTPVGILLGDIDATVGSVGFSHRLSRQMRAPPKSSCSRMRISTKPAWPAGKFHVAPPRGKMASVRPELRTLSTRRLASSGCCTRVDDS